MKTRQRVWTWLLYVLWSLFVNACNVWLIRPMAADFSVLGIAAVFILTIVWLTTIPAAHRRNWIGFTAFSLLLGDGLSELMYRSLGTRIAMGVVMVIGLALVAWLFAKVRWRYLLSATLVLVVVNVLLPLDEWSLLTHFSIVYRTQLNMDAADLSALPLQVMPTTAGNAVVTLQRTLDTKTAVEKMSELAGDSPDELQNLLRNYNHRYSFVEVVEKNGRFTTQTVPQDQLGEVDPLAFTTTFFPFTRAYWTVESGRVVQFMAPAQSPQALAEMTNDAAGFPASITGVAVDTQQQELSDWGTLLDAMGVTKSDQALHVQDHRLSGSYQGRQIDIPVTGTAVIGTGSFTAANTDEVLLQGANLLEVVSLDTDKVVSVYHGDPVNPIPNDVVIGQLDNTGRDVIFVNASPAIVLQANAAGAWKSLYRAPNYSLRFEGTIKFAADKTPEVMVNDPSYMRNSPVRYFTSYTWRQGTNDANGNLVRNWRVYTTNLVNVHEVQFTQHGPHYVVADMYGSGKVFVLKRHSVPVVWITAGLLAVTMLGGWMLRLRNRRRG